MDFPRALTQIAEIHAQIAKGEIYRGYRSVPVAASGMVGLLAAALQSRVIDSADPAAFLWYWTTVAALAGVVGLSEIARNYAVREGAAGRRRTRRVVGQFLPALAGGALLTASIVHLDWQLASLLPGVWAICFGIGTFASRPYLPPASAVVAWFYFGAGAVLLWTAELGAPTSGWLVGGTFGAGQLIGAAVLYLELERSEP